VSGEVVEHHRRAQFVVHWADGGNDSKHKLPAIGAVLLAKTAVEPEQEQTDEGVEENDEDEESDDKDEDDEGTEEDVEQSGDGSDDPEKTEDEDADVQVHDDAQDSDYEMDDSN
jgi:hypothetical protein